MSVAGIKIPPGRDNSSSFGSGTWLKEAQTTNVPNERRFQRIHVADRKREALKPQGRSEIGVGAEKRKTPKRDNPGHGSPRAVRRGQHTLKGTIKTS
jgi:hypothetical protein